MRKYYIDLVYFNPYDIENIEKWLTDMSIKGYELIKIIYKIAIFRKVTSNKKRYDLCLIEENNSDIIHKYYYNSIYVTSFNDFYIFSSMENNQEINITHIEDSYLRICEKLESNIKVYLLILSFSVLLSSMMSVYICINNNIELLIKTLFFYLPIFFAFVVQIVDNKFLLRRISTGNQRNDWKSDFRKKKYTSLFIFTFYLVYILLLISY